MSERFFEDPILNSPYECPTRHWELVDGIPTQEVVESRRESRLITPIPQPKKRGGKGEQAHQPDVMPMPHRPPHVGEPTIRRLLLKCVSRR